jgi:hypothetical protein
MNKIDLKITFSQLEVLVSCFSVLTEPPINHRDTKVARSVLDKLMVKIKKKHIDFSSKNSFLAFRYSKRINIPLEYYEAHFLEKFLELIITFCKQEYELMTLRRITSEINQKLA